MLGLHRGATRLGGLAAGLIAAAALGCATPGGPAPEQDPARRARVHYDLGVDHLRSGRPEMAIVELERALALRPGDAWTHVALAEAYRQKEHRGKAEQHLREALRIAPGHQPARLNLSALYIEMNRFEEAIAEAERLVADPTFPAPWRALTNLGWAQFKLGRLAEARTTFQRALDRNPQYWPALLDLGILESDAGNRMRALELFRQVVEISTVPSARAEANYRIAEVFIALGNRERAIPHLSAAAEQLPESEWGRKSEAYLEILR